MKVSPGSRQSFIPPSWGINTAEETWPQSLDPVLANLQTELGKRTPRSDNPHTWLPTQPDQEVDEVALDYLRLVLKHYESQQSEGARDTQ